MIPTPSTTSEDGSVSANGQPSLSDRVKGLRLGEPSGKSRASGASWLPWLLCLIMAVTWASFAIRAYTTGGFRSLFGGNSEHSQATTPSEGAKAERPTAKTSAPAAAPGEMVLTWKGNIIAPHQIQVCPIEVSGRVEKLTIEEGKFFKKGAVLAELDRTPFEADLRESKAMRDASKAKLEELEKSLPLEIKQAEAQLEEATSLRDQYKSDFDRFEEIRKRPGGGAIADKEYEQAKFGYFTQSARVKQMSAALEIAKGPKRQKIEAARAELEQADARLKRSQWRYDNTKIVAPMDGIVLTKRAEIGNLVNALAMNAALNAGICDMADLTDLEVELDIQERDIHKVFDNQDCTVVADAYPEYRYQARVARVMPIAKSSNQTIQVRVKVYVPRAEEGKRLRPQMGAVVNFFNKPAGPEPTVAPPPTKLE